MPKFIIGLLISSIVLINGLAHASFQLETMTVILDASEQRKVFSVKNRSNEPILLSTKVADIAGGSAFAHNVIISPPITRIEPDQSQQINFVLKKGVNLSQEALLKVSFQGIGAERKNTTRMPIRQDIAMLIIPTGMRVSQSPWETLAVKQQGDQLILSNTGQQVIRLSPNFTGLPGNEVYNLGQFYLRPGENRIVTAKRELNDIRISPLSRYGFKMQNDAVIKVVQN